MIPSVMQILQKIAGESMRLFLFVLCALALLVVLFLFIPQEAGISYEQNQKKKVLRVHFRILGIPFSFRIPLDKKPEKPAQKAEEKAIDEKKPFTVKRFIAFVKSLGQVYRERMKDVRALFGELRKMVSCKELTFTIDYGTKNPALTGVLNGAVWTAGSLLLKTTDALFGIEKMQLHVHPDFTKEFLCLHFLLY